MSYPALEEFQSDSGRTYARWCVLMALQPLLTHDTPIAMKLDVVHRAARVSRGEASKALRWLIEEGYLILHDRDARGCPSLTLAYRRRIQPVPDGNIKAG
jgi:hypothetical protein